jgi:hypothetical protein
MFKSRRIRLMSMQRTGTDEKFIQISNTLDDVRNYFNHSSFKSFDDWPSSDMLQTDMKGRGHLEFTAVRLKIISKRVLNKYGACLCADWTDFSQNTDHCHAPIIKRWGINLTISPTYPHKEDPFNQNVTLRTYLTDIILAVCLKSPSFTKIL